MWIVNKSGKIEHYKVGQQCGSVWMKKEREVGNEEQNMNI